MPDVKETEVKTPGDVLMEALEMELTRVIVIAIGTNGQGQYMLSDANLPVAVADLEIAKSVLVQALLRNG